MVRTETYNRVSEFLKKYPLTIAFRLSKHVKILDKHLNGRSILCISCTKKSKYF